jgi:hypothetical protein
MATLSSLPGSCSLRSLGADAAAITPSSKLTPGPLASLLFGVSGRSRAFWPIVREEAAFASNFIKVFSSFERCFREHLEEEQDMKVNIF